MIIGSASAALQNIDASSVKRRETLDNIHTYLRTRRVPRFFQKVITDYYEHVWANVGMEDQGGVLSGLPQTLRVRLTLILNRDLAQRIPVLANFSASMFIRLVQRLGNETFLPGEFIVKTGEVADAWLLKVKDNEKLKDELLQPRPGQMLTKAELDKLVRPPEGTPKGPCSVIRLNPQVEWVANDRLMAMVLRWKLHVDQ